MKFLLSIISIIFFSSLSFTVAAQSPAKMRDGSIKGPQTFAIVIGISSYKYVRPLAFADKDAEMFRDYLKSPGGGSVKDENIFCLLNNKAISANFWGKGFQWLKAKKLQKGDRLFIYLAGHGDAIDQDQFFFLSYDCNPAGDKNNYLVAGAIQLYNLKKKIAAETTKGVEVFFIMDACRSSELPGGSEGQNFLNTAISEKRAGEIIMLATGAGQESLEDASIGNGHGLFTYYLVDGLTGSAENVRAPDNKITYQEIQNYVDKNVPSIAQQQFKRKQDPYFCCNETTERVISTVDTAYLSKWLKLKKQQRKGPGSSFEGTATNFLNAANADTTLLQIYDLFNKAINNNKLAGQSSAEYYFETMNKKFAGDPYTLDAKSTLAVEFINEAQNKVNDYLTCTSIASSKQKQDLYETGLRLEKAIKIIGEDDADYAKTLLGRMYFLKASGDFGSNGMNGPASFAFENAYSALAIDPDGAYIQNKLALLHLENNSNDSALFYAEKATRTAPKWVCAAATLLLVKNTILKTTTGKKNNASKKPTQKNSFGMVAGSGAGRLHPIYNDAPNSAITGVKAKDLVKLDLGIIFQINVGKNISIRPAIIISSEGGSLVFETRPATGGQSSQEIIKLKNTAATICVPVILHLSENKVAPFISIGPSFSYVFSQDANSLKRFPIKKSSFLADAGFGIDIPVGKSKLILSPEIKYSQGFNDQRENAGTEFTNNVSSLRKRGMMLNIYLRGK